LRARRKWEQQYEQKKRERLRKQTQGLLYRVGLDFESAQRVSDEQLLRIPLIGPASLALIREEAQSP